MVRSKGAGSSGDVGTFGAQAKASPKKKKKDASDKNVQKPGCIYTPDDIKYAFQAHDSNGDGFLDFNEMRTILTPGHDELSEKQLRLLWRGVDCDKDGRVEFDEFVDFVHGKTTKSHKEKWQDTFYAFSGSDDKLSKTEFMDLCQRSSLLDDDFTEEKAGAVFEKASGKEEFLDPKAFSKAMARLAKEKKVNKNKIIEVVTQAEGPHRHDDYGGY